VNAAAHSVITVLAAGEPSKVPFYIAGGILVSWAVVLSALGLSQPDFPGSPGRARAVIAVSALLVLGTVSSAVATSSKRHNERAEAQQQPKPPNPAGQGTTNAPAPTGGGGATVKISADPSGQLKFQQASVTAKAGKVTIEFDNPAPLPHDVTITAGQGKLGGTKTIAQSKATATVDLKPGTYTFYCSVDSHRQAGMEGKLTVS
jgi:plastocyanin